MVEDHVPAEAHRIAGKVESVSFADLKSLLIRYERANLLLRFPIKGCRIKKQPAAVERTKAGIEMVEAGIRQTQ